MQVKKQQLEQDMEQWAGWKLGKAYVKAVYCHLAYLTHMQSTSYKMPGEMKLKLESDMEQRTGYKLGKERIKAVYCHPAYLAYMKSTSCEMPGWMKYQLESRLSGEISVTSDMQMTPPLWQKAKN